MAAPSLWRVAAPSLWRVWSLCCVQASLSTAAHCSLAAVRSAGNAGFSERCASVSRRWRERCVPSAASLALPSGCCLSKWSLEPGPVAWSAPLGVLKRPIYAWGGRKERTSGAKNPAQDCANLDCELIYSCVPAPLT